MRDVGYAESLPDVVGMGLAPLRAFGKVLEAITDKDAEVSPYEVGVVTSALVDYAERRLADALAVVKTRVGEIEVGFDGDTNSIADKAVDAELTPAPKRKAPRPTEGMEVKNA